MPARPPDVQAPLVLIVDDNAKNLKLAKDVLLAAGFRTLEAATAAEGIALASDHLPDVVLLDLRLPDLDGADVARWRSTTTLPGSNMPASPATSRSRSTCANSQIKSAGTARLVSPRKSECWHPGHRFS